MQVNSINAYPSQNQGFGAKIDSKEIGKFIGDAKTVLSEKESAKLVKAIDNNLLRKIEAIKVGDSFAKESPVVTVNSMKTSKNFPTNPDIHSFIVSAKTDSGKNGEASFVLNSLSPFKMLKGGKDIANDFLDAIKRACENTKG